MRVHVAIPIFAETWDRSSRYLRARGDRGAIRELIETRRT